MAACHFSACWLPFPSLDAALPFPSDPRGNGPPILVQYMTEVRSNSTGRTPTFEVTLASSGVSAGSGPTPEVAWQQALTNGRALTLVTERLSRCRALLHWIAMRDNAQIFHDPVDTATFTDYVSLIQRPICFRQIHDKLNRTVQLIGLSASKSPSADASPSASTYVNEFHFAAEMRLVFTNCMLYNDGPLGQMAAVRLSPPSLRSFKLCIPSTRSPLFGTSPFLCWSCIALWPIGYASELRAPVLRLDPQLHGP